jgi:hypothetical protein
MDQLERQLKTFSSVDRKSDPLLHAFYEFKLHFALVTSTELKDMVARLAPKEYTPYCIRFLLLSRLLDLNEDKPVCTKTLILGPTANRNR